MRGYVRNRTVVKQARLHECLHLRLVRCRYDDTEGQVEAD
jgi:hypothetical protein